MFESLAAGRQMLSCCVLRMAVSTATFQYRLVLVDANFNKGASVCLLVDRRSE
jgi:hypothetical protein